MNIAKYIYNFLTGNRTTTHTVDEFILIEPVQKEPVQKEPVQKELEQKELGQGNLDTISECSEILSNFDQKLLNRKIYNQKKEKKGKTKKRKTC